MAGLSCVLAGAADQGFVGLVVAAHVDEAETLRINITTPNAKAAISAISPKTEKAYASHSSPRRVWPCNSEAACALSVALFGSTVVVTRAAGGVARVTYGSMLERVPVCEGLGMTVPVLCYDDHVVGDSTRPPPRAGRER